jgi:hypothetical protein
LVDVIAIGGAIVGCEGPTAIIRWAKAKGNWLGQLLERPHDIPSRDCLRRTVSALNPNAFQERFRRSIAECLTDGWNTTFMDSHIVKITTQFPTFSTFVLILFRMLSL